MYAIIKNGGKQYKVSEGDVLFLEKMEVEASDTVEFDEVVMVSKDGATTVGSPLVKGAKVVGKVLKNGKAKKILVSRYRPKNSKFRKRKGHRQPYTQVEIQSINA